MPCSRANSPCVRPRKAAGGSPVSRSMAGLTYRWRPSRSRRATTSGERSTSARKLSRWRRSAASASFWAVTSTMMPCSRRTVPSASATTRAVSWIHTVRPSAATTRYSRKWSCPASVASRHAATAAARSSGCSSDSQNPGSSRQRRSGWPSRASAWGLTKVKRRVAASASQTIAPRSSTSPVWRRSASRARSSTRVSRASCSAAASATSRSASISASVQRRGPGSSTHSEPAPPPGPRSGTPAAAPSPLQAHRGAAGHHRLVHPPPERRLPGRAALHRPVRAHVLGAAVHDARDPQRSAEGHGREAGVELGHAAGLGVRELRPGGVRTGGGGLVVSGAGVHPGDGKTRRRGRTISCRPGRYTRGRALRRPRRDERSAGPDPTEKARAPGRDRHPGARGAQRRGGPPRPRPPCGPPNPRS